MPFTNIGAVPAQWSTTYGEGTQIIALDYSVFRHGTVSIRLDAHTENDVNNARECDTPWHKVAVGDHVVAKCWLKTEASQLGDDDPCSGARLGVDLWYSDNAPNWGVNNYLLWGIQEKTYYNPHNAESETAQYVPWGASDWTQRTVDFIVPSTYFTVDNLTSSVIAPTQANIICVWVQAWSSTYFATDPAKIWFADAELYINPHNLKRTLANLKFG